jgi:hypothetical protein
MDLENVENLIEQMNGKDISLVSMISYFVQTFVMMSPMSLCFVVFPNFTLVYISTEPSSVIKY